MTQIDFSFLMGIPGTLCHSVGDFFHPRKEKGGEDLYPIYQGREKQVYNISHTRRTWKTRNFIVNVLSSQRNYSWLLRDLHWRETFFIPFLVVDIDLTDKELK